MAETEVFTFNLANLVLYILSAFIFFQYFLLAKIATRITLLLLHRFVNKNSVAFKL